MLLAHRDDYYDFDHPAPDQVLLLIEVAASSLDYDRHTKVPFYAARGIREVWIVDLEADRIEAYSEPQAGRYRNLRRYAAGDSVAPAPLGPGAVCVGAHSRPPPRRRRPLTGRNVAAGPHFGAEVGDCAPARSGLMAALRVYSSASSSLRDMRWSCHLTQRSVSVS